MKPLIVLLASFLLSILVIRVLHGQFDALLAARIAMGVMLLFTAVGHVKYTTGMANMLPAFVPGKIALVYITGLLEVVAAITLQVPALTQATGVFLIVFFMVLLPANIYAALNRVNYETGAKNGAGAAYLWFRVPLQVLFIAWVYWCALYY